MAKSVPGEVLKAADRPVRDASRMHGWYGGKMQTMPKCLIRDLADFAVWYTPGVAAPCREIQQDPSLVFEYTNKANTIAIVSDGSRVLGLGNIGPEAGLPVMEGKALLFKYLGGVDAVPLCLDTQDPDELIDTVKRLQPSFGGVNLEDIAQPKCFRVLDALRDTLSIPVWHDDQQGTATVVFAALQNALRLVGKRIADIKVAMIGMGAANVANYRLLKVAGVDPRGIIGCDTKGTLHRGRRDLEKQRDLFEDKWRVCEETNEEGVVGGIAEAIKGADAVLAFSTPDPETIKADWVKTMAKKAIVFACANPMPEIWPWHAEQAGAAVVATGRCDFSNQVNNALCFPGIFRGVLDIRARTITDQMAMAAAHELARYARDAPEFGETRILPPLDDWEVHPHIAAATGVMAQEQGVAALSRDATMLYDEAFLTISNVQDATRALIREEFIPQPPA